MALASLPRVMVDLFCGRGGWTKGFQAHGWHCIGIDLFPQPDYPGEFIQTDIAHLIELPEADFYCCSSPCENFSVHALPFRPQNKKWPWLGIVLFERSRELLEATRKPYVMENVRLAQRFIGKADFQAGSYFLWGSGIPVLSPDFRDLTKGTKYGPFPVIKKNETALKAEIPLPLASHIAQTAGAL